MGTEQLSKGFASTAGVLAGVKPDHLHQPTPCTSWTVRDLINHIVGGPIFFAITAETGESPQGRETPDFSAGDFVAEYRNGAARAVKAFDAEGAMEKTMRLPFGELPGSLFVNIAATDTFTHGWDLAKATGQPTDLDPGLASQLLTNAEGFLPDALRGPEGQAPFGPKVDPPAGASTADRLAAFLGRQP
jgi:uncharacterized protein (TIGR03086 family)